MGQPISWTRMLRWDGGWYSEVAHNGCPLAWTSSRERASDHGASSQPGRGALVYLALPMSAVVATGSSGRGIDAVPAGRL